MLGDFGVRSVCPAWAQPTCAFLSPQRGGSRAIPNTSGKIGVAL
jgi:hypothetical protein